MRTGTRRVVSLRQEPNSTDWVSKARLGKSMAADCGGRGHWTWRWKGGGRDGEGRGAEGMDEAGVVDWVSKAR